jgi:hypothetical protein
VLKELSNEQFAVSMEEQSHRCRIPVLAFTAVVKAPARDARYLWLATHICTELRGCISSRPTAARRLRNGLGDMPGSTSRGWQSEAAQLDALTIAHNAIES